MQEEVDGVPFVMERSLDGMIGGSRDVRVEFVAGGYGGFVVSTTLSSSCGSGY